MKNEALIKKEMLFPGSLWKLEAAVNGYKNHYKKELSTQANIGRRFIVINSESELSKSYLLNERIKVCLLEDGYECWFDIKDLIFKAVASKKTTNISFEREEISKSIPNILKWIDHAQNNINHYLWGGTVGPHFDCSGLVQSAFASQGIWLPRDSYQQEIFCEKVEYSFEKKFQLLKGDLLFFGTKNCCSHVAVHINDGFYYHSSGKLNGKNGIGINSLFDDDSISSYYRSIFRSVGRVFHSYQPIIFSETYQKLFFK